MTTEAQHAVRRNLGQIGHLIDVCPKCGVNNLWTKTETINGESYYYQLCASCGHLEL
jgi:predicted nucleic-acid-binding Zn-ribbon protein